jgi:hypothetical protein
MTKEELMMESRNAPYYNADVFVVPITYLNEFFDSNAVIPIAELEALQSNYKEGGVVNTDVGCYTLVEYKYGEKDKIISNQLQEIANLKAELLKHKSCETCEYYCDTFPGTNVERSEPICLSQDSNCFNNFVNRDFYCKYYEPKDEQ